MLSVITNGVEIKRLLNRFHKQLREYMTESITGLVGYPGGNFSDTVQYSPMLNIWLSKAEHNQDEKYWNGFGIGRPLEGKNNSLSGEINFPHEGINRRIAGVFARADDGSITVLHRGGIGGGRTGIGKTFFLDNFRGDFLNAIDDIRESTFCLVGELDSVYFGHQVSTFIQEIQRVKRLPSLSNTPNFDVLLSFPYTDEHSGITITENSEPIVRSRTHGIITNALASELRRRNISHANDRNRDLFIHDGHRITTLFEVKTSSSTDCLYSAIGQLLLYSIPFTNPVRLVAVLPDRLSQPVTNRMRSLGIEILYFNFDGMKPQFIDIDSLLNPV